MENFRLEELKANTSELIEPPSELSNKYLTLRLGSVFTNCGNTVDNLGSVTL